MKSLIYNLIKSKSILTAILCLHLFVAEAQQRFRVSYDIDNYTTCGGNNGEGTLFETLFEISITTKSEKKITLPTGKGHRIINGPLDKLIIEQGSYGSYLPCFNRNLNFGYNGDGPYEEDLSYSEKGYCFSIDHQCYDQTQVDDPICNDPKKSGFNGWGVNIQVEPIDLAFTSEPGDVCIGESTSSQVIAATEGYDYYHWQYRFEGSYWRNIPRSSNAVGVDLIRTRSSPSEFKTNTPVFMRYRVHRFCDWVTLGNPFEFREAPPRITFSPRTYNTTCYGDMDDVFFRSSDLTRDPIPGEIFDYLVYDQYPHFARNITSSTDLTAILNGDGNFPEVVASARRTRSNMNIPVSFDYGSGESLPGDVLGAGDYWLVIIPSLNTGGVSLATGCGKVMPYQFRIEDPPRYTASLVNRSNPICEDGHATFDVRVLRDGVRFRGTFEVGIYRETRREYLGYEVSLNTSSEASFSISVAEHPGILENFTLSLFDGDCEINIPISGFTNPPPLIINQQAGIQNGEISCFGDFTTLDVSLQSRPGQGTLTYRINQLPGNQSGRTGGSFTGVPAGRGYTVTVTNTGIRSDSQAESCSVTSLPFNIDQPGELEVEFEGEGPGCTQFIDDLVAVDGEIVITGTKGGDPGIGGYGYQLKNSSNEVIRSELPFSELSPGTYTLTLSDGSCTKEFPAIVPGSSNVLRVNSATVTPRSDCKSGEEADGMISLAVDIQAPNGQVTYELREEQDLTSFLIESSTDPVFNGLAKGTYYARAIDNQCTSNILPVTVNVNDPITLDAGGINHKPASCFGETDGLLSIDDALVLGGTPFNREGDKYDYTWMALDELGTPTGGELSTTNTLMAGVGRYRVVITDEAGCAFVEDASIGEPGPLIVMLTPSEITCNNANDGRIEVVVSGGTVPYTYSWSDGITGKDREDLPAGTYTVVVTDANNCTLPAGEVRSVTFTNPPAVTVDVTSEAIEGCDVTSEGVVELSISNGTPGTTGFTYRLNSSTGDLLTATNGNLSTTPTFTFPLADSRFTAAPFSIWVKDSLNCEVFSSTLSFTQPGKVTGSIEVETAIACFGETGALTVTDVSGGLGTLSYEWSDGQTTQTATNLVAGNYSVTITDENDCFFTTQAFELTQPDTLIATFESKSDISCFGFDDGSIDITIEGGTRPYTITWTNIVEQPVSSAEDPTGLAPSRYMVFITDDNGCEATLDQPTIIEEPLLFEMEVADQVEIDCRGNNIGEITLSATGGRTPYRYQLNGGPFQDSNVFSGLIAGNYTIRALDARDCEVEVSTTITEPVEELMVVLEEINATCDTDGRVTATVSGGTPPYEYSWAGLPGTGNEIIVPAGSYPLTVRDANGCEVTDRGNLSSDDGAIVTIESQSQPSCSYIADGSALISLEGIAPFDVVWDNGETGLNPQALEVGDNFFNVTDDNGCLVRESIFFDAPSSLLATVVELVSPTCAGDVDGILTVAASGGNGNYEYTWDHGAIGPSLSGLSAGDYRLTLEDGNSCLFEQTYTIPGKEQLSAAVTNLVAPTCAGDSDGTLTIEVTGGNGNYVINWDNGQTGATITGLVAGSYTATIEDALQCTITETYNVPGKDSLIIELRELIPPSCFGDQNGRVTIDVAGGNGDYQVDWSNGQLGTSAVNLAAGEYEVVVIDRLGCTTSETYVVPGKELLEIIPVTVKPQTCFGDTDGEIEVQVVGGKGGYELEWNTGSNATRLERLTHGVFTLMVTDAEGCTATATYSLPEKELLTVSLAPADPSCFETADGTIEAIVLGGNRGYTFTWSNGADTQNIEGLTEGSYSVTVTDSLGCPATAEVTLDDPELTVFTLGDLTICSGQQYNLAAPLDANSYRWVGPDGFQEITKEVVISDPGSYELQINDLVDCPSSASFGVTIDDDVLEADFLVAGKAFVGDTLICIDISWPVPDNVRWELPEAARVISRSSDFAELVFDEPGTYTMSMFSELAGCNASYQQVITIESRQIEALDRAFGFAAPKEQMIKKLEAYPNPAVGRFNVEISLREKKTVAVLLVNISGNEITYYEVLSGSKEYAMRLDARSMLPGIYFLQAKIGKEVETVRVLVR